MSVVAAAIIGTAVVGGVSAYMVADAQSDASKKAIDAQNEASDESLALQAELAAQSREDVEPWRAAGESALLQLQEGIDSGAFEISDREAFSSENVNMAKDPGYQFRMDEGVNALDASAAARGRLSSGAQDKALVDYGQNMGSQEYSNAYSRARSEYDDAYAKEVSDNTMKYNVLSSLAGTGQIAANQNVSTNTNLANQSTNILSNQGNSIAQSEYNLGNARAGAYQSGAQTLNQAAENWLTYKGSAT